MGYLGYLRIKELGPSALEPLAGARNRRKATVKILEFLQL